MQFCYCFYERKLMLWLTKWTLCNCIAKGQPSWSEIRFLFCCCCFNVIFCVGVHNLGWKTSLLSIAVLAGRANKASWGQWNCVKTGAAARSRALLRLPRSVGCTKNCHATQANEKPAQMTGKFHKTLAHGEVKILKKHTYTLFSTEVFLLTIIPWPGSYSFTNTWFGATLLNTERAPTLAEYFCSHWKTKDFMSWFLPFSGCKENHFYSLPFGQAEASIY